MLLPNNRHTLVHALNTILIAFLKQDYCIRCESGLVTGSLFSLALTRALVADLRWENTMMKRVHEDARASKEFAGQTCRGKR